MSLSSFFTLLVKIFVPLIGFFLLFLMIIDLLIGFQYWSFTEYLLFLTIILGNVYIYKFCLPLKKVKRIENNLVISNYIKKIVIPISSIVQINRSYKFISISFDDQNDFGSDIIILQINIDILVVGLDPNASLQYIASKLGLKLTANGDTAIRIKES